MEVENDMFRKIDEKVERESPVSLINRLNLDDDEIISFGKKEGQVSIKADVAAIILAGGAGTRLGVKDGKQLIDIAGKPVLTWSMDSFDAVADIGAIIVVCPEESFEEYIDKVVDPFAFKTPVTMAPAGDSRQESAFAGLEFVPDRFKYVIVHDGARPLAPPVVIKHLISTLKGNPECDGAVVAHPAIDTLKVVENGEIVGTPDRSAFWMAQTPQAFRTSIYRRAHAAALSDGFIGTDDSSLIERIGGQVMVVEGQRNNIKLTVPEDYLILASVMKALKLQHGSEYDFD